MHHLDLCRSCVVVTFPMDNSSPCATSVLRLDCCSSFVVSLPLNCNTALVAPVARLDCCCSSFIISLSCSYTMACLSSASIPPVQSLNPTCSCCCLRVLPLEPQLEQHRLSKHLEQHSSTCVRAARPRCRACTLVAANERCF